MARMYLVCDVGCDSDALNVHHDIVGETPRHLELSSSDAHEEADNTRMESSV